MTVRRRATCLVVAIAAAISPAGANDTVMSSEEWRSTTRQLAFDPARFFPDQYTDPIIAIRYTGDDYGYPVYSIAVRRGCTPDDKGEARKTCGARLTARMVRAPDPAPAGDEPTRRRWIGAAVFVHLDQRKPTTDAELRAALDSYGLEWLEADLAQCPSALKQLEAAETTSFFAEPLLPETGTLSVVLHADKIDFAFGGYLTRSRYVGYAKPGSPGAWANQFAASLDGCWKPATATAPWRLKKPAEPEIDPPR